MSAFSRCLRSLRKPMVFAVACGAVALPSAGQSTTPIHDIMKNLPNSPLLGQTVTVSGVVVGAMSDGAFYISALDSERDSSASTAEGIEIYAPPLAANPLCAVVGTAVTVTGTVTNGTKVNGANTPGTGITPSTCTVNGISPANVVSATSTLTQATSYGQDLPFTGMPIANTSFYAIAPTGGITDPTTGIVRSNGQFWVTINKPTNGHVFKAAGLEADEFYPPAPAPAKGSSPGIPTWDGNPERLFVDTTTFGGAPVDIGAGQILTCTPGSGLTVGATKGIGIIDYSLGYNRLLIFKTTTCTVSGSVAPEITSPADTKHFHVGTINLLGFKGAASPAYATRLSKAAIAIVQTFGRPEILAVQEVQDLATLQAIGDAANTLAGSGTTYKAYWDASQDPSRMGLGFLVNTTLVEVTSISRLNPASTFKKLDGTVVPLWENPPFVLQAGVIRAGANYQVEVVNIDTTGREGIDDPVTGPNVWMRRGQQANELSVFASNEQGRQNILIAGEYNAYSFSDGFADIVGVVSNNNPPAQGTVAQYEPSATNPALYNFVKSITVPNSTYNVLENGNARSIEHILCNTTNQASANSASDPIYKYIDFVTQPHWTTDFPAVSANDPTIAAGLTSRDGFVGAFLIPPVPTTAAVDPTSIDFGSVYRGSHGTSSASFKNTSSFPATIQVTNISVAGAAANDYQVNSTCTGVQQNQYCTLSISFYPSAAGKRDAVLTITSDSGTNPVLTINLTGNGLDPNATLTPANATFAATAAGSVSTAQTFTWTNTSPLPLAITSVALTGDYTVTANSCTGTVAGGASCGVSVAFAPTAIGLRTGTLTIQSTSTGSATLTAALSGTGVPNIVAAPTPLNFGSVDVGFTAHSAAVVVTNNSQHPIAINGVTISGDYAFTSQCGALVAAASQCTVQVTFTPTATGSRSGTLTIATSDPASPTLTVPLTGSGADFTVSVTPTSGTLIAGRQIDFAATFTPVGGFNGTITPTCIVPAGEGGSTCNMVSGLSLSAAVTTGVHVTTTSQYTVVGYSGAANIWLLFVAGSTGILVLIARRKAGLRKGFVVIACAVILAAANMGCAGKLPDHNSDPTFPGTYKYTVTATDGLITRSATFDVAVKIAN